MGSRTYRIRISNIPPELDASGLLAAVMMDLEEKITLLQVWAMGKTNWRGQMVRMTIQAESPTLEEIPEMIQVGDSRLTIFEEGQSSSRGNK